MNKVKEGVQHKHCRESLLPRGGTVHLVQQLDINVACLAMVICVLECRLCAVRPQALNNWLIKYGGCTTPPLDHQMHGTVVSDQSWRVGLQRWRRLCRLEQSLKWSFLPFCLQ